MTEREGKRSETGQYAPENTPWPETIDLNLADAEQILAYQAKLIVLVHTGAIPARRAGSLNNALAIRLRYFLDAKRVAQLEKQVQQIIALLPPEIKAKVEADLKNEA
jgi:hypothetical protein